MATTTLSLAVSLSLVVLAMPMPYTPYNAYSGTDKTYFKDQRLYRTYSACKAMIDAPEDVIEFTQIQQDDASKECHCSYIGGSMKVNCKYVQPSSIVPGYNGPFYSSNQLTNARQDLMHLGSNMALGQQYQGTRDAELECPYPRGNPQPTSIKWMKRNDIIASHTPATDNTWTKTRYKLARDGTLTIEGVQLADAGEYTCKVVFPEQLGQTYARRLTSSGTVRIVFTKLVNIQVLKYIIKWRQQGQTHWQTQVILPDEAPEATLTGLQAGQTYEVQVIAVLPITLEEKEVYSQIYTISKPSGSNTVSNIHQRPTYTHQPAYQPRTSYQVSYNPIGANSVTVYIKTNDHTVIGQYTEQTETSNPVPLQFVRDNTNRYKAVAANLTPNTAYYFDFFTSRNGDKQRLNGISGKLITTLPSSTGLNYGETTYNPSYRYTSPVNIRWTAVPYYNDNYSVRYRPSNGGAWTSKQTSHPSTVIDVSPDSSYQVEVYTLPYSAGQRPIYTQSIHAPELTSQDGHREIPPLSVSPSRPLQQAPSSYTYLVPSYGGENVVLSWTAPVQSITKYEIMYRRTDDTHQPPMVNQVDGTQTSGSITGLTPDTSYTIRVTPYRDHVALTPIPFQLESVSAPDVVIPDFRPVNPQSPHVIQPEIIEPEIIETIEALPSDNAPIIFVEEPQPDDTDYGIPSFDDEEDIPIETLPTEEPEARPIRPVYERQSIDVVVKVLTEIVNGELLKLECSFDKPSTEAYFVTWSKTLNGKKENLLNENENAEIYSISEFSQDDEGTYECSMFSQNYVGSGRLKIYNPEIVPDPINVQAYDITSTGFKLSWTEPADWTRNDRFRVSYKPANDESAPLVTLPDRSSLYGQITNLIPRTHYEVTVQTVRGSSLSPGERIYLATINQVHGKQGEPIRINCETTLTNPRRIDWYKDDTRFLIFADGRVIKEAGFKNRVVVNRKSLQFDKAHPDDSGMYKCVANEGSNVEELVTKLDVDTCEADKRTCYLDPCLLATCRSYPDALCIANYCFSCNAVQFYSASDGRIYDDEVCQPIETNEPGSLPIRVEEPLPPTEPPISVYPPRSLTVRVSSTRALAAWTVPRSNAGRGTSGNYEVSYTRKTNPGDQEATPVTATVSNRLRHTFSGLSPDTTYTMAVTTIGDLGRSQPITKDFTTRPNLIPVQNARIQNVQSTSFDVVFDADSSPVKVDVSTGFVPVHSHTVQPNVNRYTVPNLTPTTPYKIELWRESAPSAKRTLYQETNPSTPNHVMATSTPTSLEITWDDDATGLVTHYQVTYEPIANRGIVTTKETISNFIVIDGLKPYTAYEVGVIAHSRNRESEPHTEEFRTAEQPIIKPHKPIVQQEVFGNSMTVYWDEDDDVDVYELTYNNKIDDAPAKTITILSPDEENKELTNLKPGPYRASLTAMNEDNGLRSEPTNFDFDIPIEPVIDVQVTDKTSDEAAIIWSISPSATSDDSIEYKVEVTESGSGYAPIVKYSYGNTVTVEGLTPGTEYDVTVTAVIPFGDDIDEELSSEPVKTTFVTSVPKPANVVVEQVGGNQSINLNWVPVHGADYYQVTYFPEDNPPNAQVVTTSSPSQTTATIDSLQPNTKYIIEVTAIVNGVQSEPTVQTVTTNLPATGSLEATLQDDVDDTPESSFEITWEEVPDASGYQIRYKPVFSDGSTGEVKILNRNWYDDTSITIENLEPSTQYSIEVIPYASDRDGTLHLGEIKQIKIDTPLPAPSAPIISSETSEESQSSTVEINWEKVPKANQYEVQYYAIENGGDRSPVQTETLDGSSTGVTLDRLEPGSDYVIEVTPLATSGQPGKTLVVSASTPLPAPLQFDSVVSTDTGSATINVDWSNIHAGTKDFEIVYYPTDEPYNSITTYAGDRKTMNVVLDDVLPGKQYTVEITPLSQTNKRGNTVTSNVITPLDVPTSIETTVNENVITVLWGRPTAEVTGFEISATPINKPGNTVRHEVPADQQSFDLTDLQPETEYLMSVVAQNDNLGLTSQPLSAEETTEAIDNTPNIPEYPPILTPNEDGQYLIKWSHPNYPPAVYRIIWKKADGAQQENLVPNTDTSLLVDLEPNSNYKITVQALMSTDNPMKNPDLSDSVHFDVQTSMPNLDNLNVSEITDLTATITWDEPPQSEFIDNVIIKLFDVYDPVPIDIQDVPVSQGKITYEGLYPQTTYRVEIVPVMGDTQGTPVTEDFTTAPLRTVPSVKNLEMLEKQPTAIVVGWQPQEEYSPTYRLTLTSKDGEIVRDVANTENSYTFSNLNPATRYTITITAVVNDLESAPAQQSVNTPLRKLENLQPYNIGTSDVSIRWTASPDNPDYYRINLRPENNPLASEKQFDVPQSKTEIHISSLAPGTSYTVSVRAMDTNLKEYSDALVGSFQTNSAVVTTPAPVEGTEIFSPESKIVTVEWEPSQNPIVSGYNVVYTDSNGVTKTVVVPRDINTVMIEDLSPNLEYSIYVSAFLDTGEPEPIEITEIKSTVFPDSVTYHPIDNGVIESAPNSGEVIVRWHIPEGTPVDSIILSYNNNGVKQIDLPNTASHAIIRNLEPGDRYPIQVSYLYQGEKDAVERTEYTPVPTQEVLVQWYEQRGARNYTVEYNEVGSTDVEKIVLPRDVTTLTLTDLKPSTDYNIRIIAGLPYGNRAVPQSTPRPEPDHTRNSIYIHPPRNVNFELDDNESDQVTLSWRPPSSNPRLVTNYKIVLTPIDNPNAQTIEAFIPGAKSKHVIKGLQPHTKYNVTITSINTQNGIHSDVVSVDDLLETDQSFPLGPGQDDEDGPTPGGNIPNFRPPEKTPRPIRPDPGSAPQTGTGPQSGPNDGHGSLPVAGPDISPSGTDDGHDRLPDAGPDPGSAPQAGTGPQSGPNDGHGSLPVAGPDISPSGTDDGHDRLPDAGPDTYPGNDDMFGQPEEPTDFPYERENGNLPSGSDHYTPSVGVVPIRNGDGSAGFNWGTAEGPGSYIIYYKRSDEPYYNTNRPYTQVDKDSPVIFFPSMEPNVEYDFRIDGVGGDLTNPVGFYYVKVNKTDDDSYSLKWETQDDWNQRYGHLAFKPNQPLQPQHTLPSGLADDEEEDLAYTIVSSSTSEQPEIIPVYTEQVDNEFTNWVRPIQTYDQPSVASPTSLRLLWSPSLNENHRQTNKYYHLEIQPVNGEGHTFRQIVPAYRNRTISGLRPGVSYRFVVRGDSGEVISNFTVPAYTTSGRKLGYYRISDVRVQEILNRQLLISWPVAVGATRYILKYNVSGVSKELNLDNPSVILPKLPQGGEYSMLVIAVIDGNEIPIYKIIIRRKYVGPPPPRQLEYRTSSYSMITLLWETVPDEIDGYRLRLGMEEIIDGVPTMVEPIKQWNLTANTTEFSIENLVPGNQYQITLESYKRDIKTGRLFFSGPIVLHIIVPVPTVNRYVFSQSSSEMTIRWYQIQIRGGDVQYEVTIRSPTGNLVGPVLVENTEFTVQNLEPGIQYTFLIRTKFGDKYSKYSELKFWLVETQAQLQTVYRGSGAWDVTWSGNSSLVDHWKVQVIPANTNLQTIVMDNINRNQKRARLTGLQPNQQYTVNVYGVRGNTTSLPISSILSTSGQTTHTQVSQNIVTQSRLMLEPKIKYSDGGFNVIFTPKQKVDRYQIKYKLSSDDVFTVQNYQAGLPIRQKNVFVNLPAGVYDVTIQAFKGDRGGKLYRTSLTVKELTPVAPALTYAQENDGNLYIKWHKANYEVVQYVFSYVYKIASETTESNRVVVIPTSGQTEFKHEVPMLSSGTEALYSLEAILENNQKSQKSNLKLVVRS